MSNLIPVQGRLSFQISTAPVSGIRVEMHHSERGWLGSAVTDAKGLFSFYTEPFGSGLVLFKLFRGATLIATVARTEEPLNNQLLYVSEADYDAALPDRGIPEQEGEDYFTLTGSISYSDAPWAKSDGTISLCGATMSDPEIITTVPVKNGSYQMQVSRKQLLPSSGKQAEVLYLLASTGSGNEEVTAQSGPIELTERVTIVNLSWNRAIPRATADDLFAQIEAAVAPFLDGNAPAAIDPGQHPEKLDYLAKASGQDDSDVRLYLQACAYAVTLSNASDKDAHPRIPFALLRTGLIATLDMLVGHSATELEAVLDDAHNRGVAHTTTIQRADGIDAIKDWQLQAMRDSKPGYEDRTLGSMLDALLGTTEAPSTATDNLLKAFRDNTEETPRAFWASFDTDYGASAALKAKNALQLLGITGYQRYLAGHLMGLIGQTNTPRIESFAGWTDSNWVTAINASVLNTEGNKLPKRFLDEEGQPKTGAVAEYATSLRQIVQQLFHMDRLYDAVLNDSELRAGMSSPTNVATFLSNNPEFDFRVQSVHDIDAPGSTWNRSGIASVETLKADLAPLQRLTRLAGGRPEAVIALYKAGITSSQDIVNMPLSEFADVYGAVLGGGANAASAYAQALKVSAAAQGVVTATKTGGQLTTKGVLPLAAGVASANPNLSTLFGSMEQCGCEYCMSVYSPSAYYVDILNFLKKEGATHTNTSVSQYPAYEELQRRRPDLWHIDMTCKNANTPLPYIDLVNELLERLVLPANTLPASYQTSGTSAELSAHPEHVFKDGTSSEYKDDVSAGTGVNSTGYTKVYDHPAYLRSGVYPDALPFNLPLEEARTYLQHLGYSREELMRMFKPVNAPANTTGITDYNLLHEVIGISKEAADIITDTVSTDIWKYYGFSGAAISNHISPSDSSVLIAGNGTPANWVDLLRGAVPAVIVNNVTVAEAGIDVILHQLRISYKELLQLLSTMFLNNDGSTSPHVRIVSKYISKPDTCVLKELMLQYRDGDTDLSGSYDWVKFFSRMHRFVRLWQASDLPIYDLDVLLTHVQTTNDIDAACYSKAMRVLRIARELQVAPIEIIGWWDNISTHRYPDYNSEHHDLLPSYSDSLFQNRSLQNPPDQAFAEASNLAISYENHIGTLVAGLRTDDESLRTLVNEVNPTNASFNLSSLSILHAAALIQGALGVSASEFIRLKHLAGVSITHGNNPVTADRLTELETLLRFRKSMIETGLSLDDLDYLTEFMTGGEVYLQGGEDINRFYESIRRELKKVREANTGVAGLDEKLGDTLVQLLAAYFRVEPNTARYMAMEMATYDSAHMMGPFVSDAFLDADTVLMNEEVTYRQLEKVAYVVRRMLLSVAELQLLHENYDALQLPLLTTLHETDKPDACIRWFRFAGWVRFRDRFHAGAAQIAALINATASLVPQRHLHLLFRTGKRPWLP
jgi:hypothetical protein